MFKYKKAYKLAAETVKAQDDTIATLSEALSESQGSLQKYIDENNALMEQLEKTKRELDTTEKEYVDFVNDADRFKETADAYVAELNKALTVQRLTGECEGCRFKKIPQKCASCTRNSRAVDKYDCPDAAK